MNSKKILAAKVLGISPQKVRFRADALSDIQKAITRSDIRGLLAVGKVVQQRSNFHSRVRARAIKVQKKKGRQRGKGSHKGSRYSLVGRKEQWVNRIRAQRRFLEKLRIKAQLGKSEHRHLYLLSKGGYFRNIRHIKLYLTEHNLLRVKQ